MVDETAARSQVDTLPAQSLQNPIERGEDPYFKAAVTEIEAAAWGERGIFEGDYSAPGPLIQNERFGPPPEATLNFIEDLQQTAAELKRAAEVIRGAL